MLSVITNIYNEKTKGPTLMELFTATGKLKMFFLTNRDVQCVHHRWHGTHRYDSQVLATHVSTKLTCVCVCVCGKNTSNISSCQKNFFSFPVAVNNSIQVDPLVFLLWMFVITGNITKRPVFEVRTDNCDADNICGHVISFIIIISFYLPNWGSLGVISFFQILFLFNCVILHCQFHILLIMDHPVPLVLWYICLFVTVAQA